MVNQIPLGELVCAEEQDSARKRPQQRRKPTAVEAPPHAFLPQNSVVRRAEGCVFGRNVRVALLPRLHRIQGVHKHIAGGAPEAAGDHGLRQEVLISIFSTRQPASDRAARTGGSGGVFIHVCRAGDPHGLRYRCLSYYERHAASFRGWLPGAGQGRLDRMAGCPGSDSRRKRAMRRGRICPDHEQSRLN